MKKYKKSIAIQYEYVNSPEGETAIAEVFDDIFRRIVKKKNSKKDIKMKLDIDYSPI